jgi:hypothetical protein
MPSEQQQRANDRTAIIAVLIVVLIGIAAILLPSLASSATERNEVYVTISAHTEYLQFTVEDSEIARFGFKQAKVSTANSFDPPRIKADCKPGIFTPAVGSVVTYRYQPDGTVLATADAQNNAPSGWLSIAGSEMEPMDETTFVDLSRSGCTDQTTDQTIPKLPVWGPAEIGQELRAAEGFNSRPLLLLSGTLSMYARAVPFLGTYGERTLFPVSSIELPTGSRLSETPKVGDNGEPVAFHRWWGVVYVGPGEASSFTAELATFAPSLTLLHPGSDRGGDIISAGVFTRFVGDPNTKRAGVIFALALAVIPVIFSALEAFKTAQNPNTTSTAHRTLFLAKAGVAVLVFAVLLLMIAFAAKAEVVRVQTGTQFGQGFLFGDVMQDGRCRLAVPAHVVKQSNGISGAVIITRKGEQAQGTAGKDLGDDFAVMDVLFPDSGRRCMGRLTGPNDLTLLLARRPGARIETIDAGEWRSIPVTVLAGDTTSGTRLAVQAVVAEQRLQEGMSGSLVVADSGDYLGLLIEVDPDTGIGIVLRWDRLRQLVNADHGGLQAQAVATERCFNAASADSGAHLIALQGKLADTSQDPANLLAGKTTIAFTPGQPTIGIAIGFAGDEIVVLSRLKLIAGTPWPSNVLAELSISTTPIADGGPKWQKMRTCRAKETSDELDCPLAAFRARQVLISVRQAPETAIGLSLLSIQLNSC